MTKFNLIIDGNQYLYRAFHTRPLVKNSKGLYINALQGAYQMIMATIQKFNPDVCAVVFDHKAPNWRHKLYDQYKVNRTPMPIELRPQLKPLRRLLRLSGIRTYQIKGYEADDVIASLCKITPAPALIDTLDKDLQQLQKYGIKIYNSMKDKILTAKDIQEKWGTTNIDHIKYVLALAGDKSDNIPGVKGYGLKTAIKKLAEYQTFEALVKSLPKDQQENAVLSLNLVTLKTPNIKSNNEVRKPSKKLLDVIKHYELKVKIPDHSLQSLF